MLKSVRKSKPFTGSKKSRTTTSPGSIFFRTLRILRLRAQNPKDPEKRTTDQLVPEA